MPDDQLGRSGRWGLRDMAIVVAGLAACMALARAYYLEAISIRYVETPMIRGLTYRQWVVWVDVTLAPIAAMLVVLRLTRPGASWRRATREPGFVAALAACLLWIIAIVQLLIGLALPEFPGLRRSNDPNWLSSIGFAMICTVGPVILVLWLIQAIGGRWRPRPDFIDRAGRALGICWILLDIIDDYFRTHLL